MNLENLRKQRHMSRREIAQELGVTEQTIYNAERNRQMSVPLLEALASYYCVSTDFILDRQIGRF